MSLKQGIRVNALESALVEIQDAIEKLVQVCESLAERVNELESISDNRRTRRISKSAENSTPEH